MINKNKFSIKNTKKVLHKVGKQWVVVSAVLLGLVAGGAAVTNANADTTTDMSANHATAAETSVASSNAAKPARTASGFGTAAPASMALGAEQGTVKNIKGHNIPTNATAMKADAKKYVPYADVNHLTEFASLARQNGAASQYADLFSLASDPSRFVSGSSMTIGSDANYKNNSDANNWFGILNRVQSDMSAISGQSNNHYMDKASNALSKVDSLANASLGSTVSGSFGKRVYALSSADANNNVQIPLMSNPKVSGLVKSVSSQFNSLSSETSGSISLSMPTLPNTMTIQDPNSNISVNEAVSLNLNVPQMVNSGYQNLKSDINSNIMSDVDVVASNVSTNTASSFINFAASNMKSQLNSNGNPVSSANTSLNNELSSVAIKLNSDLKDLNAASSTAHSITSSVANSVANSAVNSAVNGIPSIPQTESKISQIKSQIYSVVDKKADRNAQSKYSKINNGIENLKKGITTLDHYKDIIRNNINTAIDDIVSGPSLSSKIKPAVDAKLGINSKGSLIQNDNSGIAQKALSVADSKYNQLFGGISGFGPYAKSNGTLSGLASLLGQNSSEIVAIASNVASSKGKSVSPASVSSDINKAISGINKANNYFSDITPNMSNAYNGMINAAASLANSYKYDTQEPAYEAIYSNAKSFVGNIPNNTKNRVRIINHMNSSVVDEAGSIANSMSSTSSSMNSALIRANNANVNPLENSLLGNTISNLSNASEAYNNNLINADTSENLANEGINFMNNGSNVGTTTITGINGNSFNTNSLTAPNGYHLASDANDNSDVTINNGSTNVDVANGNPVVPSNNNNNNNNGNDNFMPFFPSTSASANVMPSGTSTVVPANSESARNAQYVVVAKALQLHTSPNFTKRNGVAVIKPGAVLNVEKTVQSNKGLRRYEVRYNNKNYFVTANKHLAAYESYAVAKPSRFDYVKVNKALQLHTSADFNKHNGVEVVKPGTEFKIDRVVRAHGLNRYEISYRGSVYFITTNAHFTTNAYLQKNDFRKHGRKSIRAIKAVNSYRHANFSKRGLVRHFRRGTVLPVRRVITIGNGEVTRLQLTNGRYVSANKDLVEPIR